MSQRSLPRPIGGTSPGWSRRRVLQLAAFGAVAAGSGALADVIVRGLGIVPSGAVPDAAVASRGSGSASPSASPSPSPSPDNRIRYLSRADLMAPPISALTRRPGLEPGLIFLTPANGAAPDGPMIVTDGGEPVWLHPMHGPQATGLRAWRYRGKPVLAWWEGRISPGGIGAGEFVIVDATYREVARVRAANGLMGDLHEFLITPDDSAIFLITNRVTGDVPAPSGPVAGEIIEAVIQEIDIATGRLLFEWHSLPAIDPAESYLPPPSDGEAYDYAHANSLDLLPNGDLLLSLRHTWGVYRIERMTGAIAWRLGGRRSDFTLGDGLPFAWQHDVRALPDGRLTIFDNGARNPDPRDPNAAFETQSRGLVVALDEATMAATVEREVVHPAGVLATSQGSFQLFPDGVAFLGWGQVPRFSEFDAAGQLRLDASFPTKGSYRALRQPWVGRPAEPPAVAAVGVSGGGTAVYASWNGATEVATWEVLGGPDASRLRPLGRAPRTGFETVIRVTGPARSVAVRALDANGVVLGQSEATRIA